MAEKVYQSKIPGLSLSVNVGGKLVPVQFIAKPKGHGEVTVKDPDAQKGVEASEHFLRGTIRVKWTPLEKAQARLAAAKEAVEAAQKELDAAKAEVASLSPKKPEPAKV